MLDVLADMDAVELHEEVTDTVGRYDEGRAWTVVAFAGDTEVEVPEIGLALGQGREEARAFHTGLHNTRFRSLAAARAAVQNFVRELGRPIEVVEVPLEEED